MNKQISRRVFLSLMALFAAGVMTGCGPKTSSAASTKPTSSSVKTSVASSAKTSSAASSSVASSSSQAVSSVSVDETQPVVTFYWNYTGAPSDVYLKENFTAKHRITLPDAPVRTGYLFTDWYTEAACTNVYDVKSFPTASFSLYAGWIQSYTFEAEYVDLDGKAGMGYSANVEGTQMICTDNGSAHASNGYYVSYLYYNGANLEFDFNAAEAVTNAYFVVRLSSEFYDVSLDDTNFRITVNDTDLTGFYFNLSGALPVSSTDKRPFTDFTVSTALSLPTGANVIKLIVNNTNAHGGTMYADAPIIDCIYLGTEKTLTWSPHTENIHS